MVDETRSEGLPEGLDLHKLVENPVEYIKELDESGKLAEFFPAFALSKGVQQSPSRHKEGDVFTHTLMALGWVKAETPSDREFGPVQDEHDILLIVLALVYHDTGKRERNLHDKPESRVFHDVESVKHAKAELAGYLPEEDLEIVLKLIRRHERILEPKNISTRINKLHRLFAFGGKLDRARLLLKFSECDLLGREVSESHSHLAGNGLMVLQRNIGLYKVLKEQESQGISYPIQHVGREIADRINKLVELGRSATVVKE